MMLSMLSAGYGNLQEIQRRLECCLHGRRNWRGGLGGGRRVGLFFGKDR